MYISSIYKFVNDSLPLTITMKTVLIYTDENVDFVDTVDIVDRSRYLCLP